MRNSYIMIGEVAWRKVSKKIATYFFKKLDNSDTPSPRFNGELRLLQQLFDEWRGSQVVVFDVGGNCGDYAELVLKTARDKSAQVSLHAFEPVLSSYCDYRDRFGKESIILNHCGASDRKQERLIYLNKEGSTLASLYQRDLRHLDISMQQSEHIELIRLDDYCTQHDIQHINLLKLDVEGHELAALNGLGELLSGDFIDAIQFEYGGANLDARVMLRDLFNLLEPLGFTIYKVMPGWIEERGYHPNMENYFYSNYLALSDHFRRKSQE